jgi:nicotinamidase-related amidase
VVNDASTDLHGSAPDKSKVALLLIDVINDLDFPEADELLRFAVPMASHISALTSRARAAGVPVIYVNDNFGRWRSDFRSLVEHCVREKSKGRRIVETLRPEERDYFVVKPKHSGFFATTLDTLLKYLGVETVILTGIAANICVLFTANDAFMRDLQLIVPTDCVASNTIELTEYALDQIRTVLKGDTPTEDQVTEDVLWKLLDGRMAVCASRDSK